MVNLGNMIIHISRDRWESNWGDSQAHLRKVHFDLHLYRLQKPLCLLCWGIILQVIHLFYLVTFKISLFLMLYPFNLICLYVFIPLGICYSSWIWGFIFVSAIMENYRYFFSPYAFHSTLTQIRYVLGLLILPSCFFHIFHLFVSLK